MKLPIRKISIILIVLAGLVFLLYPKLFPGTGKQSGEQKPGGQDQELPVQIYVAQYTAVENSFTTTGTVSPNEEVEIRSELPRKITGIYFKEGNFVPQGKLLFKLDDSDLQAQLRKLELDLELQTKQAERETQLLEKGLLNQDEYDIRATGIEKIGADIELVEINLEKTRITSPISGLAGFRNVSIGSFVNNTVVLTTVKDIRKVKIDFTVPERFVPRLRKGMEIRFTVEGYDDEFTGTVVSFDPQLNENTRTMVLRALADNPNNRLFPGGFVKVKLVIGEDSNTILVPSEAVVPVQDGQSVFLLQGGRAVQKTVTPGIRTEREVEITSGISPGDTVITTNILRIRNNSKVKPTSGK